MNCDSCGACCKTYPILVSEEDAAREPLIRESALVIPEWQQRPEWRYKLHPLPFLPSCCFLGNDNLCTVYETRPSVCRRFEAGSAECQEARARVGIPPLGENSGL